jgi:hypothetical protein
MGGQMFAGMVYREELSGNAQGVGARESLNHGNTLLLEGLGFLPEDNLGSVLEKCLKTLNGQVLLVDLAREEFCEDLLLGLRRNSDTKNQSSQIRYVSRTPKKIMSQQSRQERHVPCLPSK